MYELKFASKIYLPYFRTPVNTPVRNRTFSGMVNCGYIYHIVSSSHGKNENFQHLGGGGF